MIVYSLQMIPPYLFEEGHMLRKTINDLSFNILRKSTLNYTEDIININIS